VWCVQQIICDYKNKLYRMIQAMKVKPSTTQCESSLWDQQPSEFSSEANRIKDKSWCGRRLRWMNYKVKPGWIRKKGCIGWRHQPWISIQDHLKKCAGNLKSYKRRETTFGKSQQNVISMSVADNQCHCSAYVQTAAYLIPIVATTLNESIDFFLIVSFLVCRKNEPIWQL